MLVLRPAYGTLIMSWTKRYFQLAEDTADEVLSPLHVLRVLCMFRKLVWVRKIGWQSCNCLQLFILVGAGDRPLAHRAQLCSVVACD